MELCKELCPRYDLMDDVTTYDSIHTEYLQSMEEGLDVEAYQDLFEAVRRLPRGRIKARLGDVLFEIVAHAEQRPDYPYREPSDLEGIRALRPAHKTFQRQKEGRQDKVHGAWLGRICGCMLGTSVETIRTNELIPFLKESGNYPMHRYVYTSDLTEEVTKKYKYQFWRRKFVDKVDGMPADDDTNYTIMGQEIIEKFGKDFTPQDVLNTWVRTQPKDCYWTAERVAYVNYIHGYMPPQSAVYKNPHREWIGAQIRADYFGYINPGDPQMAAEMAWRDASVSHVKNGIYGEMFVAAMLAVAAVADSIEDVICGGLAQIPATSRFYEAVTGLMEDYQSGMTQEACFEKIHAAYDEYDNHYWCHTISNALVVVASLLYGAGDYAKTICMSVETGYDTDCNAATAGSIFGMLHGLDSIPEYWTAPMKDKLKTTLLGIPEVRISDRVQLTLEHIRQLAGCEKE